MVNTDHTSNARNVIKLFSGSPRMPRVPAPPRKTSDRADQTDGIQIREMHCPQRLSETDSLRGDRWDESSQRDFRRDIRQGLSRRIDMARYRPENYIVVVCDGVTNGSEVM